MATATSAHQLAIANLYVALFNRAPDASGFAYWGQAMTNGAPVSSIAESLLNSPESLAIYARSQSATDFVTTFYQTVFNRAPDANGLTFWTGELNAAGGVESDAAKAQLVMKIVDVVSTPLPIKPAELSDAQYAETVRDREIFREKAMIGVDFATQRNSDDLALAKQVIAHLNTLKIPTDIVPAVGAPEVVVPEPVVPAPDPFDTFTLTTGADTFTGGAGNDIFNGPVFSRVNSINTHDKLDGGDGIDTLNLGLYFVWREIPTLTNLEIVNVTTLNSGVMLDLRKSTGITHVNVTGSDAASDGSIFYVGDATLSVANQTAAVAFSGSTAANLSLTLNHVGTSMAQTTVDLAGTDPVAGIGAGARASSLDITANNAYVALAHTTASASVVSVNVAATGTNALTLSAASAATVEDLTVTGSGSVDFSGRTLSALRTFTGGDGGVTLSVDALSADARINLGAGDNVVTLARGSEAGAVVVGGSGNDTFHMGAVMHATGRAPGTLDTLTGGAGRDTFTFDTADASSTSAHRIIHSKVTAVITDFETGVDQIKVAGAGAASATNFVKAATADSNLVELLMAAEAALNGTVHYYVGQVGSDAFLVTDINGTGFTNLIQLNNVGLAGINMEDITLFA
ncbi:DUF4214 domain-containing protein [Pigmentiphaga aceris]|nr:DUF4214 domain-containing protein [Pigmentiphaga aceris]